MKAGRMFDYFALAGLIFAASILSACGSKDMSNSNSSNSTVTTGSNANAGAVEAKNRDRSPVTSTISDIFAETGSSPTGSVMEKYMDREMTLTGGVLYEISSDSAKVGKGQNTDFSPQSSSPQYFVTCKGKVAVYSPEIAEDVAKYRDQGQAQPFTVKGNFKEAGSYNNKHWVILEPCALIKP